MKNKPHLVISRYNEDISWVDDSILGIFDVFVYNKGSNLNHIHLDRFNTIEIENIGRESHTYLHHIRENYNSFPEKIIFTQAHPNDHVSKNFKLEFLDFLNSEEPFRYFSKNILEMSILKDGVEESGNLNGSFWRNKHTLDSCCVTVPMSLISDIISRKWEFGTGAIFGVDQKAILARSREFYSDCIDILNKSSDPVNPPEGHAFERSWYLIFNQ
jgi:hypothetical protein